MPTPTFSFTLAHDGLANVLKTQVKIMPAFDPTITTVHPVGKEFFGIWDTGATNTVITRKVVDELNLKPCGMVLVGHAGQTGKDMCDAFMVNVRLPNNVGVFNLKVTQMNLTGVDVLIGMDVISKGDFAITHKEGKTTFTFRMPSVGHLDFVKQPHIEVPVHNPPKPSRNAPCSCGSGKKYKNCHGKT